MTKKDFIALADWIRLHNKSSANGEFAEPCPFTPDQLRTLSAFCETSNPRFLRGKWLNYINNGGKQ